MGERVVWEMVSSMEGGLRPLGSLRAHLSTLYHLLHFWSSLAVRSVVLVNIRKSDRL